MIKQQGGSAKLIGMGDSLHWLKVLERVNEMPFKLIMYERHDSAFPGW